MHRLLRFHALFVALSLAFVAPAAAITLDGQLDPDYGEPVVLQSIVTNASNATWGRIDFADGGELDGLYAKVEAGVLYLFLAGNQLSRDNPSDPGFFANHLNLLLDTRSGGQHVMRADNFDVGDFPGHRALANLAGLTLESGFAADYWFGAMPTGDPVWGLGPFQYHVWSAELLSAGGGPGAYLGMTPAGVSAGLSGGSNPLGVQVAIDNRNIAGVAGTSSGCAASSGAGVVTGIEWAIPLAALGNPEGCVSVIAFLGWKGNSSISNQMLPPLPLGACAWTFAAANDFSAIAGEQAIAICGTSTPARAATWGALKIRYR